VRDRFQGLFAFGALVLRLALHALPFVLVIACMFVIASRFLHNQTQYALPFLLCALCVLAIGYRYYSAFLAAKVVALDDARPTPAHRFYDGQNYDPTNKYVLFGHHFAAIAGAGPLIGPVLAIQYGYMPGLLWVVIGVCLAGAVQDMLVLAASVRRGGKSLAEIARTELGRPAAVIVSAAILFIVVIALAGLGIVVVKALGGETVRLPKGMQITLGPGTHAEPTNTPGVYHIPGGARIYYPGRSKEALPVLGASTTAMMGAPLGQGPVVSASALFPGRIPKDVKRSEPFQVKLPEGTEPPHSEDRVLTLPDKVEQVVPGSSWGTFTIACTIPIALVVGWYMYRIRKGRVVEASLIGAVAVLAAVIAGRWVSRSALGPVFSLTRNETILALTSYGFVAAVLPVWLLLCPRDYLSSFLKIGTILLLVAGVLLANPRLPCPPVNQTFLHGGPTFKGDIFPFVFICIMCGSISGFHALVSSGTTPKMVERESHVRPIGYGAMLMEGLVGIVALIAAASLDPKLYYDINTDLAEAEKYQDDLNRLYESLGIAEESASPMRQLGVADVHHLRPETAEQQRAARAQDLNDVEQLVGGESLRGRTGGAVTLAVGMALVFTKALEKIGLSIEGVMQYWYHFAIMFEALFILTTIDAGTRIARFLLQETLGRVHPKFERTDWLPGALLATLVVTGGWGLLIWTGSISTIWPMFGIANQLLAVIALALVTTLLINTGRARYALVTLLPMLFVTATTMTAGAEMIGSQFPARIKHGQDLIALGKAAEGHALVWSGVLSIVMALFVITCVGALLVLAASRWVSVVGRLAPARSESVA
jgi:carbon starvation protein